MSYLQNGKLSFNRKLPFYGAIGFGIGFALLRVIMITNLNLAQNATADLFPFHFVDPVIGMRRGFLVGAIGGASLGLAFKDKINSVYFSLSGALGFSTAFAFVLYIAKDVSDIGWSIEKFIFGSEISYYDPALAKGVGAGALIGSLGGLILGLASPKGRIISSILLCLTGTIWFVNAFAFGFSIYTGNLNSIWNGVAGAVGGAIFGFVLGLNYWVHDKIQLSKVS